MEAADSDLARNVMGIPLAMGARGDFLTGFSVGNHGEGPLYGTAG